MTDELENKIRDWLEKQGYPLEMIVARTFQENDIKVSQSTYYIDPETEKPREIDVVVQWNKTEQNQAGILDFGLFLFIECKSQQKDPWIIFSNRIGEKRKSRPMRPPATYDGHSLLTLNLSHNYDGLPRLGWMRDFVGYGITQAFGSKVDVPYQALMSSVKAAVAKIKSVEQYQREDRQEDEEIGFQVSSHPVIAIPIVVTDALLFECYLDENNSPTLSCVSSSCLEWKYPLKTEFGSSDVHAYIYNANAIDQLLEDAKRLQQELFAKLHPLLDKCVAEYFKGQG